jgi:predicted 3-demethylubiquinone-9 3-methyltransferase (glyoxalase superfamily)
MDRILTCLMFTGDQYGRAEEAMELYVSLFDDSRIVSVDRFGEDEGESGVRHARFVVAGRELIAMDSGAPHGFTFTPATSLFVETDDEARLDAAFERLAEDGAVLMPLQAYPFSPRFAWVNDRFGVSWQLYLTAGGARSS